MSVVVSLATISAAVLLLYEFRTPLTIYFAGADISDVGFTPFVVGGPSDIPAQLSGTWKVSVVATEHCWIRYENLETKEVHTTGRYAVGYGGQQDANGTWVVPRVSVAGVQWDQDKRKEGQIKEALKKGTAAIRTVVIKDPPVYKGPEPFGFRRVDKNCSSFAADAWEFYTGEEIPTGFLYDDPAELQRGIMTLNARSPDPKPKADFDAP